MDCSNVVSRVKPSVALVAALDQSNNMLGTGTGFVFSKKGILVTCDHVVRSANKVLIKFSGGEFIEAEIVIRDSEHDLALLKFNDDSRIPIPIAEAKNIQEGMKVIFSGYPLGLQDLTTHIGVLSAITQDATGVDTYLIDGTVNSGNSGCPLMNADGKVIGVVNAKRRERSDLLSKVERMSRGAISLHNIDLVEIYQAIISNVQLGIGYAVPATYIPEHKNGYNLQNLNHIVQSRTNPPKNKK
ncbi:MAG: serine protease [Patescibacteria group bacterium]